MFWIWDLQNCEPMLVIPIAGDTSIIETIAHQPGGNLLAVGGIDWLATGGSGGAVCLWDIVDRQQAATLDSGPTVSIAFHPTGRAVAAGTFEGGITIWDVPTQQCTASLEGTRTSSARPTHPMAAGWHPAATTAPSGSGTARRHASCQPPPDTQVKGLLLLPDGQYLYRHHSNRPATRSILPSFSTMRVESV